MNEHVSVESILHNGADAGGAVTRREHRESRLREMRRLIVSMLLQQTSLPRILTVLTSRGFDCQAAKIEIKRAVGDPYVQASLELVPYAKKLEGLLRVYERLDKKGSSEIDELSEIDEITFLDRYYCRNRPVLIRRGAAEWPAVKTWDMAYFLAHHGSERVQYMSGRRYTGGASSVEATLADFVAEIRQEPISNDRYLVATNFAFKGSMRVRLRDCLPLAFLPSVKVDDPHIARLWLGPRGTVTPLHHDVQNVVFVQIVGTKRFLMSPAYEIHRLDSRLGGVFSGLDPVALDRPNDVSAMEANWVRVTLEPGDILFIPLGWWHWVYAMTESISVNFADFPVAGSTDRWPDPRSL